MWCGRLEWQRSASYLASLCRTPHSLNVYIPEDAADQGQDKARYWRWRHAIHSEWSLNLGCRPSKDPISSSSFFFRQSYDLFILFTLDIFIGNFTSRMVTWCVRDASCQISDTSSRVCSVPTFDVLTLKKRAWGHVKERAVKCQFHRCVDSLTAVDHIDRFSPQADWKLAHVSITIICFLLLQHCSWFHPNATNIQVTKYSNNNNNNEKNPRQASPTLQSDLLPSFSLRDGSLSQMAYVGSFHITSCQLAWDQGFSLTSAEKAFQTEKEKEQKKFRDETAAF